MFTVRVQVAAELSQELQRLAGKLDQQIDEAEGIVSRLRRISEYDEVRRMLGKNLECMRLEKCRMQEMMAALDEIQQMYHLAESRITGYGEKLHWINLGMSHHIRGEQNGRYY